MCAGFVQREQAIIDYPKKCEQTKRSQRLDKIADAVVLHEEVISFALQNSKERMCDEKWAVRCVISFHTFE